MIIVRPKVAGQATSGAGIDGLPVPSGSNLLICWDCWGPVVTHEWFVRVLSQFSGDNCQVCAVELIWDKPPCRGCKPGVAHTQITNIGSAFGTWQSIVKPNPHRYGLIFGALAPNGIATTPTVVTQ